MAKKEKIKVVIITGLSGAGKTNAADWFEDHGYYCIDNMPPSLIKNFLELTSFSSSMIEKVAFVVDIRSDQFFSGLKSTLDFLRDNDNMDLRILFLEASDATLIKRFSESRRNHPLATGRTTRHIIEQERSILADLKNRADLVIDTTNMKVSEFYAEMDRLILKESGKDAAFSLNIISFGYKYGVPQEADMVFDVRFIPNPFYVASLKELTGNNKKVQSYVMKHKVSKDFVSEVAKLISKLSPAYRKEGKNYLNIAFGCTGGQHRSVTMANVMAEKFKEEGYRVSLEHREL